MHYCSSCRAVVLDDLVISNLVKQLSESNPISTALRANGCLSTTYNLLSWFSLLYTFWTRRKVESYSIFPIFIIVTDIKPERHTGESFQLNINYSQRYLYYRYSHFMNLKNIHFCPLFLLLSKLFFEVCNSLGTSQRKHNITAVCSTNGKCSTTVDEVQNKYSYEAVFGPLLKDRK